MLNTEDIQSYLRTLKLTQDSIRMDWIRAGGAVFRNWGNGHEWIAVNAKGQSVLSGNDVNSLIDAVIELENPSDE